MLFGLERFLVEFLRISPRVVVGLSQPQLWSLALVALGLALLYRERPRLRQMTPQPSAPGSVVMSGGQVR